MRVTIRYRGEERILDIGEGMTVADAIGHAGIPLKKPCGGGGRCGKCKVQAVGALTPPDAEELSHLSAQELQQGIRLACLARIAGGISGCHFRTCENRDMIVRRYEFFRNFRISKGRNRAGNVYSEANALVSSLRRYVSSANVRNVWIGVWPGVACNAHSSSNWATRRATAGDGSTIVTSRPATTRSSTGSRKG